MLELAEALVLGWLLIKSIEFLGGRLAKTEWFKRRMKRKYSPEVSDGDN